MQIKWSPKLIDDNGWMWKKKGDVSEESEWWRWQISMFYVLESFVNMWQGVFSLWWNLFFIYKLLCYFYNKLSNFYFIDNFFITKQKKLYYVRGNRVQGVPFPYSLYYMMNLLFLVLDFTKLWYVNVLPILNNDI